MARDRRCAQSRSRYENPDITCSQRSSDLVVRSPRSARVLASRSRVMADSSVADLAGGLMVLCTALSSSLGPERVLLARSCRSRDSEQLLAAAGVARDRAHRRLACGSRYLSAQYRRAPRGTVRASANRRSPLLPVLDLRSLTAGDIVHDRYLYLPSIGVCAC